MGSFSKPYNAWTTELATEGAAGQVSATHYRIGYTALDDLFGSRERRTDGRLVIRLAKKTVVCGAYDIEESPMHLNEFRG